MNITSGYYLVFYVDSTGNNDNILDIIKTVKASNKKIGLSIKPNTPVSSIKKYLNQIDLVLVMSVEPGFGGQSFMENSLEKISELNIIKNDNNLNIYIEVDGGINDKTSKLSINAGANALVAGSFIYNAKNVKESINQLKTN